MTHTFHEQIDDIWMRKYAFPAHHAESFPPKHRLFVVFFGVVDVSLLARRVVMGETDLVRGEAVVERLAVGLEEGLGKVRVPSSPAKKPVEELEINCKSEMRSLTAHKAIQKRRADLAAPDHPAPRPRPGGAHP